MYITQRSVDPTYIFNIKRNKNNTIDWNTELNSILHELNMDNLLTDEFYVKVSIILNKIDTGYVCIYYKEDTFGIGGRIKNDHHQYIILFNKCSQHVKDYEKYYQPVPTPTKSPTLTQTPSYNHSVTPPCTYSITPTPERY